MSSSQVPARHGCCSSSDGWISIMVMALIDLFSGLLTWPQPSRSRRRSTGTSPSRRRTRRYPLVRMILGDIVRQYRVVEDLQQRLAVVAKRTAAALQRPLLGGTGPQPGRARDGGIQADGVYRRATDAWASSSKGPTGSATSTVSWMVARCFSAGAWVSPRSQYWHDLDSGFAGRQPLPARAWSTVSAVGIEAGRDGRPDL